MEEFITPKIKICGIRKLLEADYLNEAQVDYAGFVFYEKSRRNISLAEAQMVGKSLIKTIQKVAVTVSPNEEVVKAIIQAGFDVIQIHGILRKEVADIVTIPLWRAVNVTEQTQLEQVFWQESVFADKVTGYVLDGAEYGAGKTFDWQQMRYQVKTLTAGKKLILAGGLNVQNVSEGIQYFTPDIVDVSTGVEDANGKSRKKILDFVREVRK